EEDLLDDVATENAAERRAGNHGNEHEEADGGPEVRRQEAVQGDGGCVASEHVSTSDLLAAVGDAEDPVPAHGGRDGLNRRERDSRDDVLERDRGDDVPQVREPAAYVPAERCRDR